MCRWRLGDTTAKTDGGSVTITLYSGNGTVPVAKLATLGTISDATLSTAGGLVTLNVPAGPTLAANTRYWIEVTGSSSSQAQIGYENATLGTGASGEYTYEQGQSYPNSASGATIASVSTAEVACCCAGTLIQTDRGEVPVESLVVGDRILTVAGGAEPVRWIGRRSYAGRFLAGQGHLMPILFRAGSLGEGLPRRDLRVSPSHAMFLDGVLVPAQCLVNGMTIRQERDCKRVEYFHVELAAHDVIFAEGAPSESFVDDDSRGMFHKRRGVERAVRRARFLLCAACVQWLCAPGHSKSPFRPSGTSRVTAARVVTIRLGERGGLLITGRPTSSAIS